jgi:hypothetical protein
MGLKESLATRGFLTLVDSTSGCDAGFVYSGLAYSQHISFEKGCHNGGWSDSCQILGWYCVLCCGQNETAPGVTQGLRLRGRSRAR